MTNEDIARFFSDTQAFIQGNPDLRDPQVEGWFRTRQHFRNSSEHAILQIPVGCGKTGLMALLPFEIAQGRVLVIAPNLEIRRGISTAFDVAGRECFWTSTRVLTDVSHGPFTAVLDGQDANIHKKVWGQPLTCDNFLFMRLMRLLMFLFASISCAVLSITFDTAE